jgi:phosphatidylglycerol:prolipoprotein diacylglycerol transferase
MQPILFHIGGFAVPSYGTALLLSFAIGIALAVRRARRRGLDTEVVLDVSIAVVVASFLGSRLLYVALHLDQFQGADGGFWSAFVPTQTADGRFGVRGVSVMGALPAALLAGALVLRWKRASPLPYMDVMAPSVALGAAITRIGCFLNGCCFGVGCPAWLGVEYPAGSLPVAALGEVTLHATPLYQSVAGVAVFAALLALDRRRPFDGAVVASLFVLLGLQRFAVEFLRYNETHSTLASGYLTPYQVIALVLMLGGGGAMLWLHRTSLARAR